jgi:predicted N-acyltransferase
MPDGREAAKVRVISKIAEVKPADWDACAGPENPFVSHGFLSALEDSGSATAKTGWLPRHLVLEDAAGLVVAAAPLYIKSHSMGEYVFDQAWAQAYENAGGRYYPKLLSAVPFTPVPGQRLLARDEESQRLLAAAMIEIARRHELSSVHINFATEPEARRLAEFGFLIRTGHQFHWHNRGYGSFDDFLNDLTARKRKMIRHERTEALKDLTVRIARGTEISEADWDAFFDFYQETGSRKWGSPYLTREFFSHLSANMPEKIVLIFAERDGRPIAGALNVLGADALYGRYWGAIEHQPFLHFELCYYQAIEFAIAQKLARVEAGAQGEHKVPRGYLPTPTYSAHYLPDSGFRDAVARFLQEEARAIAVEMAMLAEMSPYKTEGNG